jgi:hypothetical protein
MPLFRSASLLACAVTTAALTFAACDRPAPTAALPASSTPVPEPVAKTKTLETELLGRAVDTYESAPNAANAAAVDKATAKLDGEIAELQERVAKKGDPEAEMKAKNLKSYRESEVVRFNVAKAKAAIGVGSPAPAAPDGRTGADKMRDSAEKAADKVETGAQKAADAIRNVVK